jgi:hypothetical protein
MARRPARVISHWYRYVEDFSTSGLEFYAAVEEVVTRRGLPGVSLSRVRFLEGGIFSAKREYLRVQRERAVFDICAGPYGRGGYFFSWRLAELRVSLLARPVVWHYDRLFRPATYYRLDTALVPGGGPGLGQRGPGGAPEPAGPSSPATSAGAALGPPPAREAE